MNAAAANLVRHRAENRCEYCRLPQDAYDLTFHIEHVIARQHGGRDDPSLLCLACDRYNLHEGTNLSSVDPETGSIVNPRGDLWDDHFALVGAEIVGLTPVGRATARLLQMNSERRLILRKRLLAAGEM